MLHGPLGMLHCFSCLYNYLGQNVCLDGFLVRFSKCCNSLGLSRVNVYPEACSVCVENGYENDNSFTPASVAQLDAPSDWRPGGRGFNPRRGRQHSFVEIDHEIFSTVILSLPLIQEGQLSVSGERICTILVNRLED